MLYLNKEAPVTEPAILKPFGDHRRPQEISILKKIYWQTLRTNGRIIMEIVTELDELGNNVVEGYEPLTLSVEDNEKERREWRRNMKKLIEWAAHPSTGMDRIAIALACFRDMTLTDDLEEKMENLGECRSQLVDLYNTIMPNPYKI